MAIKIDELYPLPVPFNIHNKEYQAGLFTLKVELWILEQFENLEEFNHALIKPPEDRPFILFEFIYELLINNPHDSIEDFLKHVLSKGQHGLVAAVKATTNASDEIIIRSMPLVRSIKKLEQLKEIRAASGAGDSEPCYAAYYDKVARSYGYTLQDFYNLTTRQLFLILTAIEDGDYIELEQKAAIAGRQLKPRLTIVDISEEQEAENDQARNELLERMKKIHADHVKGKENGQ